MLTPAEVKVNEDGTALLTQNGKSLMLKIVEPANVTITTRPTTPNHDYDALNPGTILIVFDVKIPANTKCHVTVLLTPEGVTQTSDKISELKNW